MKSTFKPTYLLLPFFLACSTKTQQAEGPEPLAEPLAESLAQAPAEPAPAPAQAAPEPVAQPAPPPAAADLSPYLKIPTEVRFRVDITSSGKTESLDAVQKWALDMPGRYLNVETFLQDGTPKLTMVERWVHDDKGWGLVANGRANTPADLYDPPLYTLLAPLKPGATWSTSFPVDDYTVQFTCLASSSTAFCADGLAVTCRRSSPSTDQVSRKHFCPNQGFRGSENYQIVAKYLVTERRTHTMSIDGVAYPDPPDSARPIPKPEEVPHP